MCIYISAHRNFTFQLENGTVETSFHLNFNILYWKQTLKGYIKFEKSEERIESVLVVLVCDRDIACTQRRALWSAAESEVSNANKISLSDYKLLPRSLRSFRSNDVNTACLWYAWFTSHQKDGMLVLKRNPINLFCGRRLKFFHP